MKRHTRCGKSPLHSPYGVKQIFMQKMPARGNECII
nr:MAG TPA: hypothetical protein [Caudoviricetes sp.]